MSLGLLALGAAPAGAKRVAKRRATAPAAASAAARYTPKPGCVMVAATNDVHGALAPYTVTSTDNVGATTHGGVLGLSAYVHNLRALADGRFLLLDAGDIFQGTMASNMFGGRAMIATYNALGYDAAAIGNHEFDFGPEPGAGPDASRLGVLTGRIAEARFPFLASNIDDVAKGEVIGWTNVVPSVLKDVGGIKVGIVGASTPTTGEATNPRNVAGLRFVAPVPRIAQEAQKLRAQGAQLVVLLAHMGGRCADPNDPNNIATCVTEGVEAELIGSVAALPPGTVDVAIGGHTHQRLAHWHGTTAILESGAQGHAFGLVQACPAPGGGLDRARSVLYPTQQLCLTTWSDGTCGPRAKGTHVQAARFAGAPLAVRPEVAEAARPFLEAVDRKERESIGALLPEALSAEQLTALIAEALRRATHADFGVQNRGGVRTAIAAGATTYREVFESVPFDNYATVLTLTGREITELARALIGERPAWARPSFSGLVVEGQGDGLRVRTDKGAALGAETPYTLCTTDFILNGGDGAGAALAGLDPARAHTYDLTLRDALVSLLRVLYPSPVASAPAPSPTNVPDGESHAQKPL